MQINIKSQENIIKIHKGEIEKITREINNLSLILKVHNEIVDEAESLIAQADSFSEKEAE